MGSTACIKFVIGLILTSVTVTLCVPGCREAAFEDSIARRTQSHTLSVKHQMPIREAFEKGMAAEYVQMSPDGNAVVLYDLTLVEDDSPGASSGGKHWQTPRDTICGSQKVKKILHVARAQTTNAHLVFCAGPLEGETAALQLNFNSLAITHPVTDLGTTYRDWEVVEVPRELIRPGDNEVILSCKGSKGWWISIADRDDILRNAPDRNRRPNRSFKSCDNGTTWTARLGAQTQRHGEYLVRLNLSQYAARGRLIGPVLDLAAEPTVKPVIAPGPITVKSLKLTPQTNCPPGTQITFAVRSGTTAVYDPKTWSAWINCDNQGRVKGPLKRFVQWTALLSTGNAAFTPALGPVELDAEVEIFRQTWADKVKVLDSHNEQILYTSIPFEYEKFDQPKLVELRKKYKLDQVVSGAKTELEKMILLRNWVSKQWQFEPPPAPYPAWDALEILQRREGFCVQYAIVYMQAALSLGIQTRFVFGNCPQTFLAGGVVSGHEVTEFWSNEYGKWIMMDAHQDEFFVDSRTAVPAGMLQLHQDLMNIYFPDAPMDYNGTWFESERQSKVMRRWKGLEPRPADQPPDIHLKWGCVRWMPRNNFYAHRFPEPIAQGRSIWAWCGYRQWQDARTPRQWRFGNYTSRRSDIEWTINQVCCTASFAAEPGKVNIHMGTVTPDFETFLINIDRQGWRSSDDVLVWRLQPGRNRIEMRIRNRAGVLGKKSWLELQY